METNVQNETALKEDEVREILGAINSVPPTEEEQVMKDLNESKIDIPDMEDKQVDAIVTVNPTTGALTPVTVEDLDRDLESRLDKEMAKLLDVSVDDLYQIPKSAAEIPFDEDILTKNINEAGFTHGADVLDLINLVKEWRAIQAEGKDPGELKWYNKMPQKVKEEINKTCLSVNNATQKAKEVFAAELIRGLIMDAGIDRTIIDLQESMAKAFDLTPLMGMMIEAQKSSFEVKLQENIDKAKENGADPEKIAIMEGVRDAYKEAYTLNGLYEAIKSRKVRVKPFDIEKYGRHCDTFLYKYQNDTPFIIKDISVCAPVLVKKFPEYTAEQIGAFIIAFTKYVRNYNSRDVVDHTFMSYFISNIASIDLATSDISDIDFVAVLLSNIDKCIRALFNLPERNYYAMLMENKDTTEE